MLSFLCKHNSYLQEPFIGSPGKVVKGLSENQANLLQRFGHARFISVDNENKILTSLLQDRATKLDGIDLQKINSESDDSHNYLKDVNQDTIGFFIAKFVKKYSWE